MINFRKIASVLASTVMIGSTIALAAAAYPAPFVQGGNADVAEVYGSAPGAAVDLAAVVEINTKLQAELAKQTATSGTSTGASATGGDAVNLASSSQRLYSNSVLNLARNVLTKTEMPSLLADGTAYDNSGTAYDYKQSIKLGNVALTFGKSGESIDPVHALQIGTASGGDFYNYTLTLTKAINQSDAGVVGISEFTILGNKYTVGANSLTSVLYLYGSGTEVVVSGGEEKKVTINDVEHTIKLVTTSGSTTGSIEVDGVRKSVQEGSSYKFAGGFEIYIKDVTHPTVAGDPRDMQLLLGAKTLQLPDGDTVKVGADSEAITSTKVNLITSGGKISQIDIGQAAAESTGDYIKSGGSYTDRVFGTAKVQFAGDVPSLDSTSRDAVTVEANELSAKVKFTSSVSGKEFTLQYALDNDNTADETLALVNATHQAGKKISVQEGENLYKDDLVLVNSGDKGRILRVNSIPANTTNAKIAFKDEITQEVFNFETGAAQTGSLNIDGQTYYVAAYNDGVLVTADDSRMVNLTWGTGAASGIPGTYTTLFPRIQLKNGEWFTIAKSTFVSNNTRYALPGEFLLSDYEVGSLLPMTNLTGNGTLYTDATFGSINWSMEQPTPALTDFNATLNGIKTTSGFCNFTAVLGPAIVIQEEKTLANANGQAICIPLTTEGTSPKTPAVNSPVFTDGVGSLLQLSSDSNKYQAVDLFGSLVTKDSTGQNKITVSIPEDQMYSDVLFTATGTTVAAGSSSSGTVKELGAPFVKDSEVSSVSTKNLIVIGGSCVNTVAAQLLGSSAPLCDAAFTAKTGVSAGQFLIQSFASPYSTGKVATLVAGFNAQDTVNAAKYFTTQAVDTTAGKTYKGTSATEATLVTTTA